MPNNRDDFSEKTKFLLASRVGFRCSNPSCRKPTSGANSDPNKTTNIGVAAHICAAASGGPRYDLTMSQEERKSPQNGIWLCQSCAKLIDSDTVRYSKDVLYGWKSLAEATSALELEYPSVTDIDSNSSGTDNLTVEKDVTWFKPRGKHSSVIWQHTEMDQFCKVTEGSVILVSGYIGVRADVFVQNVVRNNLKSDCRIIYFNLKESSTTILNSLIAAESSVNANDIRTGVLSEEGWQRLAVVAKGFEDYQLILEPYDFNQSSASEHFLNAIRNGNADVVVLDDLDGLDISDSTKLNTFLYQVRNAAIQSGTIVFLMLELNEMPKRIDRRPMLIDPPINRLSKFCDVVVFLHYDDQHDISSTNTRVVEAIIAKNYLSTQTGVFYFMHLQSCSSMIEYEYKPRKDFLEKYPGLLAGAKALVEIFDNI